MTYFGQFNLYFTQLKRLLSSVGVGAALGITSLAVGVLSHRSANAAEPSRAPAHQKVIDFEDEVVEGMNKRPLDSLNQISERDRRHKKPHLYRKRVGFRSETAETLRELGFSQ